jgi:hypothetical protein
VVPDASSFLLFSFRNYRINFPSLQLLRLLPARYPATQSATSPRKRVMISSWGKITLQIVEDGSGTGPCRFHPSSPRISYEVASAKACFAINRGRSDCLNQTTAWAPHPSPCRPKHPAHSLTAMRCTMRLSSSRQAPCARTCPARPPSTIGRSTLPLETISSRPSGPGIRFRGRLPDGAKGTGHIRFIFNRMGFNDREIVALSGAHSLGRCHSTRSRFEDKWG